MGQFDPALLRFLSYSSSTHNARGHSKSEHRRPLDGARGGGAFAHPYVPQLINIYEINFIAIHVLHDRYTTDYVEFKVVRVHRFCFETAWNHEFFVHKYVSTLKASAGRGTSPSPS